ncbi:hypothetical protein CV102_14970 [Natronococcus pandeyae]|uniref:Uncharacterized protein n=1 Tax=Natronococcus pandeyae TaxID=2055836 RepID=A0A8J8Q229_9EURY|nr:helix-turn-helix domain-containing protein [Natronococcus pandeyae]TYL38011.1 hypothetical protein CV102_14970 [Natronococcus pandeyae]
MNSTGLSPATVLKVFDTLDSPGTPFTTTEIADEFDCTASTIYTKLEILVNDDRLETKKIGAKDRVWWRPPERSTTGSTESAHSGSSAATSRLRDRANSSQTSMPLGRESHHNVIFNTTFQFIGLLEPDGTLIDANEAALSFGGLTREDVIENPFWEAHWWQISERTQSQLKDAINRAADGEFVRYEVEVQGSDRTAVIDFSLRPVTNEEGEVTLLVPEGRDITELKEREQQLQRVDQLNTVIRTIVQTVARAETRDDIAQTVCETLLEFDAYQATVMGESSSAFDDFEPWAITGGIETMFEGVLAKEAPPLSETVSASAVRTGEFYVRHDLSEIPYDYWQDLVARHGIRSYAAIPLVSQETAYGVLGVFADRPDAFDQEKQRILIELGEIIGYALYALERKEVLNPTIELKFQSAQIAQPFQAETDTEINMVLDSVVPLSGGTECQFWTIDGLPPPIVRTALESVFPSVSDPRLLSTVGETTRFQVTDEEGIVSIFDTFDGELQSVAIKDDTAIVIGRFPETVDTTAVTWTIREQHPDIQLIAQQRLLTPVYLRHLVEEQLTDRQQAVLRLAYFGGYYEHPRLSSGDELAAELGISRQTFHHHLRKAESTVFYHLFEKATASSV